MLRAIDPNTGETVREVPPDTPEAVEHKLAAAARAFRDWRETSLEERAAHMRRVAALLREDVEKLAPLMTEEMGKPIREARGEVEKCAWCAEHYAEHAAAYLAPLEIASDATRSYVQHLPLGSVVGILPWNAPFWIAFRVCAPALMAGNTVLLKHDPHVPGCGKAITDVFARAGMPEGVLQDLMVDVETAGRVLRDRRVRAASFTGSARGGGAVASITGSEVKPCVLELGGSDPCLVLADADLEEAADMATTMRTINAGQSCIAAKRILVEAPVHERFLEMLRERLAALRVGDPADPETQIGPIARAELRDELHRQVRETVEAGARCVLGGELPEGPGFFYPVTLLDGVPPESTAFREETFGPVAAVTPVPDAERAVELANQSDYGLAASVFTSPERGEALASRLETGQVTVNGVVKTDPRLPSGGVKRSGFGRELGPHGILEFVNVQQVWVGPKQG